MMRVDEPRIVQTMTYARPSITPMILRDHPVRIEKGADGILSGPEPSRL